MSNFAAGCIIGTKDFTFWNADSHHQKEFLQLPNHFTSYTIKHKGSFSISFEQSVPEAI